MRPQRQRLRLPLTAASPGSRALRCGVWRWTRRLRVERRIAGRSTAASGSILLVMAEASDYQVDRRFRQMRSSTSPRERARLREALIEEHQSLVRPIARRFAGRGEDLEDIVSDGLVGLVSAVDRYDPDRGVRFS